MKIVEFLYNNKFCLKTIIIFCIITYYLCKFYKKVIKHENC